ncbi:LytTR family DNA-binding domain-containing protein [Fulvivirga ulvae]|uniref:LytR/AlgR family response regulator transcription factor n=1 Tax=Fulvivirga ulvae TaxID=2904245 RepID=UPI001F300A0F|nr:LytTR family DNA-binding domain-containing protein [Fulvivirga ulvae]UII32146.1 LytTR family DNA-binding domain-containing protein [Fulvivirga ulvae]
MRAIIIDDEENIRITIRNMLHVHCPEIKVVAEAEGVNSAVMQIERYMPDLVFLDVNIQGGTGFDLLKLVNHTAFKLIFITAYDEFALRAFKYSAVDYLLKPIDPEELEAAVSKAIDAHSINDQRHQFSLLLNSYKHTASSPQKIILKTTESIHLVSIPDIIRCEAQGNYTQFSLTHNRKILVSKTLKEYDELLSDHNFFRVHHSHLINIEFIERIDKREGGYVVLEDHSEIPISVRKRDQLFKILKI